MGLGSIGVAVDGVAFGLLLFCCAAGLSLIFGALDLLNLSHGTLYLIGAYLAYLLGDGGWTGLALALLAAVALGVGGGAALAAALRPLAARGHLDQALATIGIAFVGADLMVTVFGADPRPADPPAALAGSTVIGGLAYPLYRLVFIGVAAVLAVGLWYLVHRSRAGIAIRATVDDAGMAAATGVPVTRVRTLVVALGGALTVTAGVLGAPVLGPAPGVDNTMLVLSLVIVVLGGAGSIPGTLLAALLVGQVQTVGVVAAPAAASFLLFLAMLAVLLLRGTSRLAVVGRA